MTQSENIAEFERLMNEAKENLITLCNMNEAWKNEEPTQTFSDAFIQTFTCSKYVPNDDVILSKAITELIEGTELALDRAWT